MKNSKEVAAELGVSEATVSRWISERKLVPSAVIGQEYLFSNENVHQLEVVKHVSNEEMLFSAEEVAEWIGISDFTLRMWTKAKTIKAKGVFPNGSFVYSAKSVMKALATYRTPGWSMREIGCIFGMSRRNAYAIVVEKHNLLQRGRHGRKIVYDPEKVCEVMEQEGFGDVGIRIVRIDSSIQENQEGWFVISLFNGNLKVVSEKLVTFPAAVEEARSYFPTSESMSEKET